jgi:hypothetical protein
VTTLNYGDTVEQMKRELYQLSVARADIRAAMEACELMLERSEDHDEPRRLLQTAMIICYARPFTDNKPLGRISNEWLRDLAPEQRGLHEDLLYLRKKAVAHTDLAEIKVFIAPPGTTLPGIHQPFERLGTAVRHWALPLGDVEKIRQLCVDVGVTVSLEVETLLQKLYSGRAYPPEAFELHFTPS